MDPFSTMVIDAVEKNKNAVVKIDASVIRHTELLNVSISPKVRS